MASVVIQRKRGISPLTTLVLVPFWPTVANTEKRLKHIVGCVTVPCGLRVNLSRPPSVLRAGGKRLCLSNENRTAALPEVDPPKFVPFLIS